MTADPAAAILLWHLCQLDDDTLAAQLRQEALDAGASPALVARAWQARAERIAGDVVVIVAGVDL